MHSFDGTLAVHGELDLADAMELETAIQSVAAQLKELGSTESLDVRRSMAVGELARRQLPSTWTSRWSRLSRRARLETTPARSCSTSTSSEDALTARLEQGNQLITPGQLTRLVRRRPARWS